MVPLHTGRSKISVPFNLSLVICFIHSITIRVPQVLRIIRKRLIQSQIWPRLTSHQITKPMVKQLMCNCWLIVAIQQFSVRTIDIITKNYSSRIFHRSRDIISYNDLVVFVPWIFDTKQFREKLDHFRRFTKYSFRRSFPFWFNIIIDLHFCSVRTGIWIFNDLEFSNTHHK